ncbi:VanZ family protein [Pullulanibacillus sp. KACC 23026]|uniref:VanZ family protein n=1 Tax=Pullulanibacillus sp. KACC 23026 TaxID=3028315 RepID=UPI0023AE793E|nr:VanZ family protein [Pullulanibacillus sp. KACC 23026]WEG13477.1 VanZ family protein [Pullulanibacillus sp. KACC 23026]
MNLITRVILLVIWIGVMLSFIWTHDIHGALYSVHFNFDINPNPRFLDVFIFQDFNYTSPIFWIAKLAHFFGFAIFDGLLFWLIKNKTLTLCGSIAFAIFTEILQLYFYRDGRLYDMMIDSLGAFLMYFIISKN